MATVLVVIVLSTVVYKSNTELVICTALGTQCNCYPSVDTPESCSLHCNSIDVCKDKTLYCRSGDVCSVTCEGYASCTDVIVQPNGATDVTITCDGTDSCKGMTASCGSGDCVLQCSTYDSCIDILSMQSDAANSFECSGICDGENIPPPFDPPSPTVHPTTIPTSHPTATPTSNPTMSTARPTTSPTSNPTSHPSSSPTINPTVSTASPTTVSTTQRSNPTVTVTKRPTLDELNDIYTAPVAFVSTQQQQQLFEEQVEIRYLEHPSLSTLCYVVIGVSTTIVICVCGIASGLVYLNHKHTQQILMAATQTYAANMNGTKTMNGNNCHYDIYPPPPALHVQSSSFIINPYQIPAIFNPVHAHTTYTPHNMTPNISAMTPVIAVSVNNDAMSNREGTETRINRKISDIPALPSPLEDITPQYKAAPYRYHQHRTSMHMTPSGYMDADFITKKHKKSEEITPGLKPLSPDALTNNSNADSNMNMKDTNDPELASLDLGENPAHDGPGSVDRVAINDERKDTDADAGVGVGVDEDNTNIQQMDIDTSHEISNTEDLSRELFATHSESHSRNVSHDVVPPNRSPWYQYHQVGSLPVIKQIQQLQQLPQERARSAVLIAKVAQDANREPLQLPLLLNNHLIPPTEYSESTYDSNMSDSSQKQCKDNEGTETDSIPDDDDDDDDDDGDVLHSQRSRLTHTNSMFSTESDWAELDDDDTYLEIKPLKGSSTFHTDESIASIIEPDDDDDDDNEADEHSETSVTKEKSGDSVMLNHAYTLMNILENEDSYHTRKSSISFNV